MMGTACGKNVADTSRLTNKKTILRITDGKANADDNNADLTTSQPSSDNQPRTISVHRPDTFKLVNVPADLNCYYSRREDESRIEKAITEICDEPEKGILILSGHGGVGKTTLMSRLLVNGLSTASIGSHSRKVLAFWLNCIPWRDPETFDDSEKQTFANELLKLAASYDSQFDFVDAQYISSYFQTKENRRVLFIFDDLFNANLLQYFLDEIWSGDTMPSVVLITRDPQVFLKKITKRSVSFKLEMLDDMTTVSLTNMLQQCYDLTGNVPEANLVRLAENCFGLPLIASLISKATDLMPLIKKAGTPEKAVQQLLDAFFKRLDNKFRWFYYAFLFFEPAEVVLVKDLSVFWGLPDANCKEILKDFEKLSLVRNVQENGFSVHQMLYDAALTIAAKHFQLIGDDAAILQQIRIKLLSANNKGAIIFDTVRKQRLSLLRQIVHKIDASSLAELCQQQDSTNGLTFLQFLYHTSWDGLDVRYAKGHWLEQWGCNNSYRVIREILNKLNQNLSEETLLQVINCRSKDNKSFLIDAFDDEDNRSQYYERFPIIFAMERWRTVYNEHRWREAILIDKNASAVLLAAVRGDLASIKKAVGIINEGESLGEAAMAAARCGHLDVVKFLFAKDKTVLWRKDEDDRTPVMWAAQNGHMEVVGFIYQQDNKSLSTRDFNGLSALMLAAANGHADLMKFLLENGEKSQLSLQKSDDRTALMMASANGHLKVVEYLVQVESANIASQDSEGYTSLMLAAENGHLQVVKALFKFDLESVKLQNSSGRTPIMCAAQKGNLDVVIFLSEQDPKSLTVQNVVGSSVMSLAAAGGYLDIVRYVYNKSSPTISTVNNDGWNPLMLAAMNGHLDVVKFAFEKYPQGISHANSYGSTALLVAAEMGNLDVVKYFCGKDVNDWSHRDSSGYTALLLAASNGYFEIVKLLYDKEPQSASWADGNGSTALMVAAKEGHFDVVKFICEKENNNNLDIKNNEGSTALILAAANGHLEIAKFLVEKGDVSGLLGIRDDEDCTAFMRAAQNGHLDIVAFLYEKDNYALKLQSKYNQNALMMAASFGCLEVVKLLAAKAGKDYVALKNQDGVTAALFAEQNGYDDVKVFLDELISPRH